MENVNTSAELTPQPPQPSPALEQLDLMVGIWELRGLDHDSGGEILGRLHFEWMEGGFYLVQRVEIDYAGRAVRGTEYTGYQESTGKLRSYFFSSEGPGPFGDVALEYVWELTENALRIWGGDVGSPASFRGEISPDFDVIAGAWRWPGGGYEATMTRRGSRA